MDLKLQIDLVKSINIIYTYIVQAGKPMYVGSHR